MGSDAAISIFDDTAFIDRVVPALDSLVYRGDRAEWLDALLAQLADNVWKFDFSRIAGLGFSFRKVCTYLDRTFAFTGSVADWSSSWGKRACRSDACPARRVCPLHESQEAGAAEDFNFLFQACVLDQCLGGGQFLGRSVSPPWYFKLLVTMGMGSEHPIWNHLQKLETRGFVVGYRFGNSAGIHGWLSADETLDLVELLSPLDLPSVDASFAGMQSFSRPGAGYEPPTGYSFEHLSLAFLRVVARLAAAESKGILWGNDVSAWGRDRDL